MIPQILELYSGLCQQTSIAKMDSLIAAYRGMSSSSPLGSEIRMNLFSKDRSNMYNPFSQTDSI
jgi:hypothetical protein